MITPVRILAVFVALGLASLSFEASAHDPGMATPEEGMIVTRHFTGLWDQVDQEAQGIALQVVEQIDGSRRAVAYWYTYGEDRKTAWYIAIGDLVENRIEMELYDSVDVGFMQDEQSGNDSVQSIGTMTLAFDSCSSGTVTYNTTHPEVGSGSFTIERLAEIMNTHCTGGISDDMPADGMFGQQWLGLSTAREGIMGRGQARYEGLPAHMELDVEVEDMPDGTYHLYLGGEHRGDFEVTNGHGEIRLASPAEDGHMLMNFDPRGMQIEIRDGMGVALSSFDGQFDQDNHQHQGGGTDDHHQYDCASGHHMGGGMGGMVECVDDGDFVEIDADLETTGVLPEARGEAEWDMNAERVRFSVEIEDIPEGSYALHVGGQDVGVIEAHEMHYGGVHGRLSFRDPAAYGMEPLDFEPRGQVIEVLQGEEVILETTFPAE